MKSLQMFRSTLFYLLLFFSFPGTAQTRIAFYLGYNLSYLNEQNNSVKYSPIFFPVGGLDVSIPFNQNIAFETGLNYARKGFKAFWVDVDSFARFEMHHKSMFQYISIPLLIAGKLGSVRKVDIYLGGGLNYNFLISVKEHYEAKTFRKEELIFQDEATINSRIGLMQTKDEHGMEKIDFFSFTPSIVTKIELKFSRNWGTTIFYDYGIYNLDARPGSAPKKLHSLGLMVNYTLN